MTTVAEEVPSDQGVPDNWCKGRAQTKRVLFQNEDFDLRR